MNCRCPIPPVDRVLLVHALEMSTDPAALLREVWRVLAGGGRLLAVVPNRRGLWARIDTTPFGHGRPYSRSQITHLLRETWFTPTGWGEALYVPPVQRNWFLRSAVAWEQTGATISAPFAGVHIVEATKQIYRAIPAPRREKRRLVPALKPVLAPAPAQPRCVKAQADCCGSGRPRLRRDSGRVGADQLFQTVLVGAIEHCGKVALDFVEQSDAAEYQPGIELQQARAGPDLAERGLAGIDAAGADQGKDAFDPHVGFGQHAVGERAQRPARQAARLAGLRRRSAVERATVVLPTIMPSTRRDRAMPTTSSRSDSVRSGAIFRQHRHRTGLRCARSRASMTRTSRSSSTAACCMVRRPGVLGEEMLTVT